MTYSWNVSDLEKEEEMIRPKDFDAWLDKAEVGARVTYHRGRTVASPTGRSATGEAAWRAAARGKVFLFRRRLGHERYEFCALRISKRAGEVLRPHDEEAAH